MNRKGDFLKFLAMLTMLIDHIGYMFFPSQMLWRIIGRLSFPIFAFLIARGYRYTSSKVKYAGRLFIFGLISQIPYIYFVPGKLNIMFTLFIGLIIIELFESKFKVLSFGLLAIGHFFPVSYGVYGLMMILIFHMTYGDENKTMLSYFLLSFWAYISTKNNIQAMSVFALFPILLDPVTKIKVPRMVGYLFYPGHITALLLIQHYNFL
ncbi:TraX family protein [Fusibacter sp. JL216-2]|uniref:TraX family protein n=1 Tax=Fusibacter sp. JL216-2 TaxID=3071453 RepID=UPI003D34E46E